jgi:hypothetical protein
MPSGNFGSSFIDFLSALSKQGLSIYILAWNDMPNPLFGGVFNTRTFLDVLKKQKIVNLFVMNVFSFHFAILTQDSLF